MSPTTLTAVLLGAIALTALLLPAGVVILAVAVLAAAVATDAALARRAPELELTAPEVLARGVPGEFAASCDPGPARRSRLRQATPADLEVEPATGPGSIEGTIVALRRGAHVLPPLAVRVEGPLGLAAWHRSAPDERTVRVYPDLPAARRLALTVRRSRFREQGMRGSGQLGLGTEFELIRDYSPDDDVRQINWRATARLGRPMSNHYRLEQDRDVLAVIDSGRLMSAPIGDGTMLDSALDALAALAATADELGDRFGALAFDSEIRFSQSARRAGGAQAVGSLYDLEPTMADTDFVSAFQRVEGLKRAFVIVFTDVLEPVAASSLLAAVPVLSRRHQLVVASSRDRDLESLVTTPPKAPIDAYRASVGVEVLEARRTVEARLRSVGAISSPPGRASWPRPASAPICARRLGPGSSRAGEPGGPGRSARVSGRARARAPRRAPSR